jgi:acyl-coenzyme A thioesterase PaaI-like protein
VAPHIADADGQINIGALAMLVDFALASSMRATLEPHQRLATVSMTMELTAAPRSGRIETVSSFYGFVRDGSGRIGKSNVVVKNERGVICAGSGSFMALNPPANVTLYPVPHRRRDSPPALLLKETGYREDEEEILAHADAALAKPEPSFIERFWSYLPRQTKSGAACAMQNGPHVGNRVGHAQGGVLLGLAAATACRTLPANWTLSGISGWYLRPGEGATLRARSGIVHQGRLTALVRTQVLNPEKQRVIEVMTTHAHR